MKRSGRAIVFFIGLISAGIIAVYFMGGKAEKSVVMVNQEEISGIIEADETDINVKVPGRLMRIMVEEGDYVNKGQIIAQLEAENVAAKVNQAKALLEITTTRVEQAKIAYEAAKAQSESSINQAGSILEAAKAQSAKAKGGARPQQIEQAKELVSQAKQAYDLTKSTTERLEKLYKEGVIAEQKIDQARTELDVAKARYNTALQQLDLVKEGAQKEDIQASEAMVSQAQAAVSMANVTKLQIDAKAQDMEAAKAQQMQAQAAVDEAMSYLKDATIKSPVSGIVTVKNADNGELVSTGMPIVTVSNLKSVWANIKIRETKIGEFNVGDTIKVKIPGANGKYYNGKIIKIAAKPSYATERASQEKGEKDIVSFAVKIKLNNDELKLKPGMTAIIGLNKNDRL